MAHFLMVYAPAPLSTPLHGLPPGWHGIRHAVLRDGTLATLAADVDLIAQQGVFDGVADPWAAAAKATVAIWVQRGQRLTEGPTFPFLPPFPLFDQFPDGRWLVAPARTMARDQTRILAADGAEVRRLHLGDGIEHLKIGSEGSIWVGWFDEGVFGNEDWRLPSHEWPPSSYGLAAFDERGGLLAHADSTMAQPDDCYALNLSGPTAYACTHSNFPIAALTTRSQTWVQTDLRGPRALAVRAPYVLAVGGYAEAADRAVLLRLETGEACTIREWRLPFRVDRVEFVDGREDAIYAVQSGSLFRWNLDQFLNDAGVG